MLIYLEIKQYKLSKSTKNWINGKFNNKITYQKPREEKEYK